MQTVAQVRRVVHHSLRDPQQIIRRRAEELIRPLREGNKHEEMERLFYWARDHFHYAHDPAGLEYIKSPEISDAEISKNGAFIGDCDDISAYLAALFQSVGYPVRLVIISPDNSRGPDFKHIYLRVFNRASKRWIPLDGTAKNFGMGWEAPAKRRREYDV